MAAILIEPVNGTADGAYVPLDGYLRRVAEIDRECDVLVIHDEVLTGLRHTGLPLDARHWEGCEPDIVVLPKGLEAGYTPVAPPSNPRRSPGTSATRTPTRSRRWAP
ncbi:aminotransferase class III-fold pyridoxal phosphate-dependent enzyme [Streptomyces sp. NPDC004435]|uniref:aminotransferase class III-fold pyridoxal phosphate-dependent enzyme n=1 Tax=Streptomyces sp. NPDC004435 TaxID=3364701 RepID=UPI0036C80B91